MSYTHKEVVDLVRELLKTQSQKELAGKAGISPQYLNDILQMKREPGAALLKYLGLKKTVCYDKA